MRLDHIDVGNGGGGGLINGNLFVIALYSFKLQVLKIKYELIIIC